MTYRRKVDLNQKDIVRGLRALGSKPCLHCGKSFERIPSEIRRRKFCSPECSKEHHKGGDIVTCQNCGNTYWVQKGRRNHVFCSMACRRAFHAKKKVPCKACGKLFFSYENAVYCSRDCKNTDRTKKNCAQCGGEYFVKPSHYEKSVYCSKECMTLGYQQRFANMKYDRVDTNQDEIADALRKAGASVVSCSGVKFGFPDLCVGFRGKNYLLEVKTPKGTLTPAQVKFFGEWLGGAYVVRSVDEALKAIGAV